MHLVELEQMALHNNRLQGEALLRLFGKPDLQPYAVAATRGSRGCNRSWQRLQTYVLLLLGKGGGADRRRRGLTVPCTYYAVNLLCRVLTMPTAAAAAAFIAACSGSSVFSLARFTCVGDN